MSKAQDESGGAVAAGHRPAAELDTSARHLLSRGRHAAELDVAVHRLWALGRNIILLWAPRKQGVSALVIPHYAVTDFAGGAAGAGDPSDLAKTDALAEMGRLLSGEKRVDMVELTRVGEMLGYAPTAVEMTFVPGKDIDYATIENIIKRYSLSYVEDRAVILFDIVKFTLFSPLEQVTQLNSLAYSVNAAYSKLLDHQIEINFARTTTGDGFYIWNRDRSIQASVNLYHFMHLVLADNAIARSKANGNTVPSLRTCFSVGGHYEYYQSEGLSPTIYSYIVGDVTIELARMIASAEPGQILVGEFEAPMIDSDKGTAARVGTVDFIEMAQDTLSSLHGLVLSNEAIDSIKCYLTGVQGADGTFGIQRLVVSDKHGLTRNVFNAKVNIYRKNGDPIFLGLQHSDLGGFVVAEDSGG